MLTCNFGSSNKGQISKYYREPMMGGTPGHARGRSKNLHFCARAPIFSCVHIKIPPQSPVSDAFLPTVHLYVMAPNIKLI
jgi:hypothetical protein